MDWSSQDLGNIVFLEHINLNCPDFPLASFFYFEGLGLTRDPYDRVGKKTMWVNIGYSQIHLPYDRTAQNVNGIIGIEVPNLEFVSTSLKTIEKDAALKNTKFKWSHGDIGTEVNPKHYLPHCINVTCPWGNSFKLYQKNSAKKFPPRGGLGILYIHLSVKKNTSKSIAQFYSEFYSARTHIESETMSRVNLGPNQFLILDENLFSENGIHNDNYDGWHISFYITQFKDTYIKLHDNSLLMLEHRFEDKCDSLELALSYNQFRANMIVQVQQVQQVQHQQICLLEHEVRSLFHPFYMRTLVNRFGTIGIYCNQ